MMLNPQQFNSWLSNEPTDAVHEEHTDSRARLIDFDAKHDSFRRGYPSYAGPGSSLSAHDGIVSRGYEGTVREAHAELVRRGEPVEPLGNIDRDVATVALARQRQVVAGARATVAAGPPTGPAPFTRYGERTPMQRYQATLRNLPAVEGHAVDLERHRIGLDPPRRRRMVL